MFLTFFEGLLDVRISSVGMCPSIIFRFLKGIIGLLWFILKNKNSPLIQIKLCKHVIVNERHKGIHSSKMRLRKKRKDQKVLSFHAVAADIYVYRSISFGLESSVLYNLVRLLDEAVCCHALCRLDMINACHLL